MAAPVRRRRPTRGDGERRGTNDDAGPGVDGERRASERERGVGVRRRGRRPGPRHLRPVRRSIHPWGCRRGSRRSSPRFRRGRAREGRLQVQDRRRRRGGRGVRRGVRDARVHPARPRAPGDGGRVERAGVPDPDGRWGRYINLLFDGGDRVGAREEPDGRDARQGDGRRRLVPGRDGGVRRGGGRRVRRDVRRGERRRGRRGGWSAVFAPLRLRPVGRGCVRRRDERRRLPRGRRRETDATGGGGEEGAGSRRGVRRARVASAGRRSVPPSARRWRDAREKPNRREGREAEGRVGARARGRRVGSRVRVRVRRRAVDASHARWVLPAG
mmetsp:Transcript_15667/g.61237  ORF Transcript_15667/g.61237 Transcript_15667/m.61237 type:complete len:329 (-) Transcript_15667:446-1432(-)